MATGALYSGIGQTIQGLPRAAMGAIEFTQFLDKLKREKATRATQEQARGALTSAITPVAGQTGMQGPALSGLTMDVDQPGMSALDAFQNVPEVRDLDETTYQRLLDQANLQQGGQQFKAKQEEKASERKRKETKFAQQKAMQERRYKDLTRKEKEHLLLDWATLRDAEKTTTVSGRTDYLQSLLSSTDRSINNVNTVLNKVDTRIFGKDDIPVLKRQRLENEALRNMVRDIMSRVASGLMGDEEWRREVVELQRKRLDVTPPGWLIDKMEQAGASVAPVNDSTQRGSDQQEVDIDAAAQALREAAEKLTREGQ